jgi:hypothetical protein
MYICLVLLFMSDLLSQFFNLSLGFLNTLSCEFILNEFFRKFQGVERHCRGSVETKARSPYLRTSSALRLLLTTVISPGNYLTKWFNGSRTIQSHWNLLQVHSAFC